MDWFVATFREASTNMHSQDDSNLNVSKDSKPVSVPVFNCIVYVSRSDTGTRARVANLAGLEAVGVTERDVLGKLIPAFKQRVSELMTNGTAIPWIDPPSPAEPGEQIRFVPVHL
jgi:hypothetical protein